MTVNELISLLGKVENKNVRVFLYNGEILEIEDWMVDTSIDDRIDINIPADFSEPYPYCDSCIETEEKTEE